MMRMNEMKVGSTIYMNTAGDGESLRELEIIEVRNGGIMVQDENCKKFFVEDCFCKDIYSEENVWYLYCDDIAEIVGVYPDAFFANRAKDKNEFDDEQVIGEKMAYRIIRNNELNRGNE